MYVLLEVVVPSAATDEERPVARARCRYEDAVSREPRETAGEVSARFTASEEDVRRSANAAVQQEIARNEVALAKDRAVELWDAGRKADAVAELKQAGTAVRARGASFGFAGAAARVAEDAEAAAEALEREGMGKSTRKEFRAESYQIRYQQENQ
jgi:Ca-activated chloride channel family protein